MSSRIVVAVVAAVFCIVTPATAQDARAYVGGSLSLLTQSRDSSLSGGTATEEESLGGSTWAASGVIGVQISERLAIEFEPMLAGEYSREYSYRPAGSLLTDVTATRRDTFLTFQVRGRYGVFEPVGGISYVRQRRTRVAMTGQIRSSAEERSGGALAVTVGGDFALPVTPSFFVVPSARLFLSSNGNDDDPLERDTRTGSAAFRIGVGVRVLF
ncbi:MAG: hypothetical protein IT178_05795 [Acidobacteria bacterium]|nr:hypothetical protein [Acidobacteriota bacterium]